MCQVSHSDSESDAQMNASAINISSAADTASGEAAFTLTMSVLTSASSPAALLVLTRLDGEVVPLESLLNAHAAELATRADLAVPVDVVPTFVVPLHHSTHECNQTSQQADQKKSKEANRPARAEGERAEGEARAAAAQAQRRHRVIQSGRRAVYSRRQALLAVVIGSDDVVPALGPR